MALPEIPDSWFKFLTAVAAFVAAVAASIGMFISHNNGSDLRVVHENQQVNTQKLDTTAAKVDAAAAKADTAAAKADVAADTSERIAQKVGAKK